MKVMNNVNDKYNDNNATIEHTHTHTRSKTKTHLGYKSKVRYVLNIYIYKDIYINIYIHI